MEPIWSPHVMQNLNDTDLSLYLEFSCTACIPGGGCTVDRALQVLYESAGDVMSAMERLLCQQSANNFWTQSERQLFEKLIMVHGKNFLHVSRDIRSKSVKECVEFYYLWKKRSSPRNAISYPYKSLSSASAASNDESITPTITTPLATTSSISTTSASSSSTSASSTSTSSSNSTTTTSPPPSENFPCKVCGRVFEKIKSRSAHMKRHKNERC